ncbi:hypothetical protein WK92_15095 [Burkholderia ubonensis]|uniref:peptidylprolyl isomerase n=1 Tax=Burkholderia ubonensis TaxID=101571 RepID=UPI00075DE80B|nr:peptidylprolyl isomerase [Burkholderia ubonensis]KVV48308.1 hypothetical protein WK82_14225 [Burkholderia ubonensis]KVW21755.1 hypothetical protein WK92_15095 [Burkholderia ubonensis]KVW47321.1 hypothetical protein WK95_06370 [Burkholderia ubonensis]
MNLHEDETHTSGAIVASAKIFSRQPWWNAHTAARILVAAYALSGCANNSPQLSARDDMIRSGVLATVNGVPILQAQRNGVLRSSGLPDTPATRQQLEAGLIVRELIRQAAETEGLGDTRAVSDAEQTARVDAENRLYVERHLRPRPVSDELVRARYDALVSELGSLQYKARIIAVKDDASARELLILLRQGQPFEQLARTRSLASNGAEGGALPWATFKVPPVDGHTNGMPLPLAKVISLLDVGEISQVPVLLDNFRVIVRLDARRPTVIQPYDSVQAALRQSLETKSRQEAFAQMVDDLFRRAIIVR